MASRATVPSAPPAPLALAFLTVVDCQPHGLLGGLLLLNRSARPLEFHCTAPVRPNRVQELLYGPTLRPFLYGELIARTLIEKAGTALAVVLVDLPELLAAREHVSTPVALVTPPQASAPLADVPPASESQASGSQASAHHTGGSQPDVGTSLALPGSGPMMLQVLVMGRNRLSVPVADCQRVHDALAEVADYLDLAEPFDRIRSAIEEAQRVSRAA